ncbi:hypothetical protein FHETE_6981 [Fusarium heterosporum]|uniref:Uncharacterized protein n=1 Tax=Fusarium heterosporum TaxID=42747 RepID=A0A8H5T8Y7_FUSHE|nr:hypothetical protein FHETE_6981 [Fusarium heterosporum]
MATEQLDAIVFKAERFRDELDQLHLDFPALKGCPAPGAAIPSSGKIQLVMARLHLIFAGIKKARATFDEFSPDQQTLITKLDAIAKGLDNELKEIVFAIWDIDPERAEQDRVTAEKNRARAMKKAEEAEEATTLVPRDVTFAPAPIAKAEEKPIFLRHFLVWAISDACSSSSNEASIRILRYDPVMESWHFMHKSFKAGEGDIQIVCMKSDNVANMAQRWGGVITTDASAQTDVTRTDSPLPDLSSAVDHGYVVLAWRFYAKGQHNWLDAEGYSISPLSHVVRAILDRAEI